MFDHSSKEWSRNLAKNIIDHYGYKFFYGKKILDLGAGQGEIASILSRLGADITAVDARQNNLDIIKQKYPTIKTMQLDLDNQWAFNQNFDIVLSIGLICHLKNYEQHIRDICSVGEHIVIETEILDSQDININIPIYEERTIEDLSFNGEGSIISSANVQAKLSALSATYKRVDNIKLNSGIYKYDWKEEDLGRIFGNRRLWFVRINKFVAQSFENQPKIRNAENAVNKFKYSSSNVKQQINNIIIKSNKKAICLFGDFEKDIDVNLTNFDVFAFVNSEELKEKIKETLPNAIINVGEYSNNKYAFQIKNTIDIKNDFEQLNNMIYEIVVIQNIDSEINLNINKTETVILQHNDKIYGDSFAIDILEFMCDKQYNSENIFDMIIEHMKNFNIPIITSVK